MIFMFLMLAIVVMGMMYGSAILNGTWPFEGMELSDTGVFGDSWGAFTSIFSALGFCGVLWTIKLQRDATRQIELDSKKRDKSERLRDFENSFFNMLNILQTIIKDMKTTADESQRDLEGRAVFNYYYLKFKRKHLIEMEYSYRPLIFFTDAEKFSLSDEINLVSDSYDGYFRERSSNFSHYFRFVYNLFKFIDDANIEDCDRKKYGNILRAQISNQELLMLFYNGNSSHGVKFKKYFNEYAVFDNLPVDQLISDLHVLFTDKMAWGENKDALEAFKQAARKGLK